MRKMAKLHICPTPIGNLEDLTLRTIRVLREADFIAAEDTRHSLRLLNHLQIRKPLLSLHEHNEQKKSEELIGLLRQGKDIALLSDAGMPGISDPGGILIRKAIEEGIPMEVLPGAAAFVTALVGSGLKTEKFYFYGFLSRVSKQRKKELSSLMYFPDTLIFYEAPHRIAAAIADMAQVLGDRKAVIARELTKRYEEYIRASLFTLRDEERLSSLQGEMVVLVEGAQERAEESGFREEPAEELLRELGRMLSEGCSLNESAKILAQRFGRKKREIYEMGLEWKEDQDFDTEG